MRLGVCVCTGMAVYPKRNQIKFRREFLDEGSVVFSFSLRWCLSFPSSYLSVRPFYSSVYFLSDFFSRGLFLFKFLSVISSVDVKLIKPSSQCDDNRSTTPTQRT